MAGPSRGWIAVFGVEREGVAAGGRILPAPDGRWEGVEVGRYQYRDGVVAPLNADQLLPPEQVDNTAAGAAGIGDGWTYAERFGDAPPATVDQTILPSAAAALQLAKPDVLAGKVLPAEQAQPVYLRESVAWKKQ